MPTKKSEMKKENTVEIEKEISEKATAKKAPAEKKAK